ncbi:hypothetical protein GCM10010344_51540 [Streptomyces bluensis]|nr:hypothetical protein GCM10010344_51540 [Streptomyces bluensis]
MTPGGSGCGESGRTPWCQLLDAVCLGPADDVAEVTAAQVRRAVVDLAGLRVEVLGRMRTERVMRKPVPVPWISPPQGGRPPKHGKEFHCRSGCGRRPAA